MEDRYLCKAKRADSGEWIVWNALTGIPHDTSIIQDTICQCTGLKDKNGKLIWEGDIILFQRDNDDCPFPNKDTKKRLGKVFYKDFRITFAIGMEKSGSGSLNVDVWKYVQNGNRVEVIGNIFDNPELLESEETENDRA